MLREYYFEVGNTLTLWFSGEIQFDDFDKLMLEIEQDYAKAIIGELNDK